MGKGLGIGALIVGGIVLFLILRQRASGAFDFSKFPRRTSVDTAEQLAMFGTFKV